MGERSRVRFWGLACVSTGLFFVLACGVEGVRPDEDGADAESLPLPEPDAGTESEQGASPDVGSVQEAGLDPEPEPEPEPEPDPEDEELPEPSPEVQRVTRYPVDRSLSPLSPAIVEGLQALRSAYPDRDDAVFSKLGASATVSSSFMHCFDSAHVDLGGREALQETIDAFLAGDVAGTSCFRRESECATVGWSARHALAGDPSPLERELEAANPRFGVVMYGTNDMGSRNVFSYADKLLDLTDTLLAHGVVPLLTTIMPRADRAEANSRVPRYNAVVRAVAEARQVPLIDYHRELVVLEDLGLAGDGVHPTTYRTEGRYRPCIFSEEGLMAGYNIRNLLTIQTLHRLRQTVLQGAEAPDGAGSPLAGSGELASPFVVDRFPFTDRRSTAEAGERRLARYEGCEASQDESGPELLYRLEIAEATRIRAMVFDRGEVDVDLHLLAMEPTEAACVARDHKEIVADLEPGTWYLSLDTFVSGGAEKAGEYLLVVVEEE